jgi:hypothetical protein
VSLQLHRVPFLSSDAIECIISSLANLKNLGVYRCPLLHVGTTSTILDIIKRNRKSGGYVHLDFYPMFHQGPNALARYGSFGATWNDPGIDSNAAILQLVLYCCYAQAREMGFDLLDWAAAFRQFLEKCPMLDWTVVRFYEAIKTYEAKKGTPLANTSSHCTT